MYVCMHIYIYICVYIYIYTYTYTYTHINTLRVRKGDAVLAGAGVVASGMYVH